jgi:diguanylate cyclase (GGDEF)-like protein
VPADADATRAGDVFLSIVARHFVNGEALEDCILPAVNQTEAFLAGRPASRVDAGCSPAEGGELSRSLDQHLLDISESALRDAATGLWNRRRAEATLADIPNGETCAMVLLDIDRFKTINDRYGHAQGDVVLQTFSRILRNSIRDVDMAARWGGDEFMLILRGVNREKTDIIIHRIMEAVRGNDDPVSFRCSAGAYLFTTPKQTPEKAFVCADAALYEAKAKGRDGYSIQEDEA